MFSDFDWIFTSIFEIYKPTLGYCDVLTIISFTNKIDRQANYTNVEDVAWSR